MGKFYDMINDFHDSSKKWDPITHYTLDATHKASTKSVQETSRGFGYDHGVDMANKDEADFGRWGGNTLGAAAAIYGGMSAYGAGAGEGAAAGGGGGAGEAGAGGGGSWLSNLFGNGGTTYMEQGGGAVTDAGGDGAISWVNADGTTGATNGAGSGTWGNMLKSALGSSSSSSGSSGSSGSSSGSSSGGGTATASAAPGYGHSDQAGGGNPALSEALARLVSEQEQTKRQQQNPFLSAIRQPQSQPLVQPKQDRFSQYLPMIQQNYGDPYARTN